MESRSSDLRARELPVAGTALSNETESSGVSWPAVWAGGFVTAALSLILLTLGTGLGFASASAWAGNGVSANALSIGAIVWMIFIQFASASMGGYLAGRLRTKWAGVHSDEVYFRDTAHGFLAWAVALVVTVAFLSSAATAVIGPSGHSHSEGQQAEGRANSYYVDTLFRGDDSKPETQTGSVDSAATTIFSYSLLHGQLSDSDKSYLDRLVMAKTGMSQNDADKRVSSAFLSAQTDTENARKALAHTLLWTFVALLIGAFSSSFAGTIGGRQRDHVIAI